VSVISVPESRWARVDIKTVSLLPNVLAKQAAVEAGAQEAWFITGDGMVTEGASSNAWIATPAGVLVTAPADDGVLRGITRAVVIEVAARLGFRLEERRFALSEALAASEAFMTSATTLVTPIVRIDGKPVGTGRPGRLAEALRAHYRETAEEAPLRSVPAA
jgi:D-alanine transaminase